MRVSWIAALWLLGCATTLSARPYSVDDLLALERYGQVLIDPSERWGVIEHRRPWTSARSYSFGFSTVWMTARLELVDLDDPGPPSALFDQEDGAGYWSGGFSPSGRSMAVFRLESDRLTLGILDMARRQVRWLATAPDLPIADQRPIWIGEDQLVYVARPSGALPGPITSGSGQRRLVERFEQARRGETPSVTLYGAGAYRDIVTDYAASTVVRADIRTGSVETLLTGTVASIALAPGGRHLAVTLRGEVVQPDPQTPVESSFQPRRLRLAVIDMARRRAARICDACDLLPFLLRWSPDGRELLYFARRDGEGWPAGHLYRLAAGQGEPRIAGPGLAMEVREVGANLALSADWIGNMPIVRARPRDSAVPFRWYRLDRRAPVALDGAPRDELIAASPRTMLWVSGNRVVPRGGTGGPARGGAVLSSGLAVQDVYQTGGNELFNPMRTDPVPVTFAGPRGGAVVSLFAPSTASPIWSLPLPSRASKLLAVARRGVAISYATDDLGVGTLTLSRTDRADVVLDRINRHLAEIDIAERIAVQAPGPNGAMLTHWLSLPAHSGPETPLIVLPYPGMIRPDGPPPAIDRSNFNAVVNPALLTGAGYAVLEPSIPMPAPDGGEVVSSVSGGSIPLRGRATDENPAIGITSSVLAAVEAAARTGRASGTKVAAYGQSFGGWAAMEMATQTDRFRAIIAAAAPYDFFAPYGFISPGLDHREFGVSPALSFSFTEYGVGNVGGPPWRVPDRYLVRSPLYAMDRITAPLMLIHGDMDFMPYSSAERSLMAMHRLGRDAILLRYGGEGHVASSPANIRDQWQRIFGFLSRYLGPVEGSQIPR